MGESGEMEWNKRYHWAQCREPFKRQLDVLGSNWIDGTLSNEGLAFEAVQLLSNLEWSRRPADGAAVVRVDDAIAQVKILTEAMLAVSLHPDMTPKLRREALDFMRSEYRGNGGAER